MESQVQSSNFAKFYRYAPRGYPEIKMNRLLNTLAIEKLLINLLSTYLGKSRRHSMFKEDQVPKNSQSSSYT